MVGRATMGFRASGRQSALFSEINLVMEALPQNLYLNIFGRLPKISKIIPYTFFAIDIQNGVVVTSFLSSLEALTALLSARLRIPKVDTFVFAMISPLVAVASRAALYPIQSIIIVALLVSGAYFHLLDIARNPPPSSIGLTGLDLPRLPLQSTIWARKQNERWKWTIDPIANVDVRV